ncbi:MAG: phage holin family protein [Burkholderiales bacterium]
MRVLLNMLVSGAAVLVTARILSGVKVDNYVTAIVVALALGGVNALLSRGLVLLTVPINILTLGLFTFVVTGAMVLLTARVLPGFHVAGFWWALAFALVLSAVNALFHEALRFWS